MQDFNPQSLRYAKLVDRYSSYIESPVLRLKFLNSAMKLEPPNGFLMKLPALGSLPVRAMLILELAKVLPLNKPAPARLRLTALMYRCRYAVYAASVAFVLAASIGLGYVVTNAASRLFDSTKKQDDPAAPPREGSTDEGEAVLAIGSKAALPLDKVWLAEQGNGYEFYSNGTRVLTEYETAGTKRSFYRFDIESVNA